MTENVGKWRPVWPNSSSVLLPKTQTTGTRVLRESSGSWFSDTTVPVTIVAALKPTLGSGSADAPGLRDRM